MGVQVYGLSPDDLESHQAFAAKHQLNFPLLADVGAEWLNNAGLWAEKEYQGQTFMGATRTTMLVNAEGTVEQLWENVQFQDHAEAVLDYIREN